MPLLLAEANKSLDFAPMGVAVGRVLLRGCLVQPVRSMPEGFEGLSGYLVKVHYEFDFAAGAPTPLWAELGLDLGAAGVTVSDAIPRTVSRAEDARWYEVTTQLDFVPVRDDPAAESWGSGEVVARVTLPAVAPRVDCGGIGSAGVRWRHTAVPGEPLWAGSRTGWFALLAPSPLRRLPMVAAAGYDLGPGTPQGLRPLALRDAFNVELPTLAGFVRQPAPAARPVPDADGPRVFVSYAQESPEHKADVVRLCALLAGAGVDVRFDQEDLHVRRNWNDWTNVQIQRADFVLVVASPMYRQASEGELPPDRHRGVQSEYVRLAEELYRDRVRWTPKILPVVLPGRSVDEIPRTFLPYTADHYLVESLTPAGAQDLLTVLLAARRPENGH
ncbi:hypothetical protein Cs7R123_01330 [Catellatospora sp. TT07R-123]|nr:hypothetical protein Cs7R123_01330 [Catellatospora sp. TT07R-123]